MATVSPLYQVPPGPSGHVLSNSAINATRTSSFAAALRKLAKQAYDPGNGVDGQSNSATGISNHQSNSSQKNLSTPSFQTSYQNSLVSSRSPPVVTIAPIPAHQIDRNNDSSRKHDGHPMLFDHRIATEQSKESIHYPNVRLSPIVQVRYEFNINVM